jgi:sporulation protein YlmC with PRC-barrel domain
VGLARLYIFGERRILMAEEEKSHGRALLNKVVVSKEGRKVGDVGDIRFDPRTGELIDVIVKNATSYAKNLITLDSDGAMRIPFSAVVSIGDFVIVSEEDIV